MTPTHRLTVGIACVVACMGLHSLAQSTAEPTTDGLYDAFVHPPADARPMVRWWWFGPAVTNEEVRREIESMKAGGFGGFEVQPTYPLAVNDPAHGIVNHPFLSPPFLDAFKTAADTAKASGLRMDLTLGTGWPYGGPQFTGPEAAGRLRVVTVTPTAAQARIDLPKLKKGESLIAAFIGKDELKPADDGVQLPPSFSGAVSFFIAGRTGMQVKRAALGAEGNVLDHLNAAAVGKFIDTVATKEVESCGPNPPHAVFCDSLESYNEDWTDTLLDEFKKRRGYDLRPLLPALTGDAGPDTADIRHDWGQTLTEVFGDAFVKPLRQFAQQHGTRFRVQAYGTPSAGLSTYADADLPEGEGYQWRTFRASRYASSASHLMGRPVTSSETFTWLHPPVFRATPLDIKGEADRHFLQGINQLICHGWPYTPPSVAAPGWSFYVPAVFNENNPWYAVMPDVNAYLTRVSHLLRQGTPANDVLIYLANDDAWAHFTPGKVSLSDGVAHELGPDVIPQLLDAGFNFDFVDDNMLERFGRVEGDRLVFGKQHYKAIILAGVERMPLATLQALDRFARGGGVVVATRRAPDRAPGHAATEEERQQIKAISDALFKGPSPAAVLVQDDASLGSTLAARLTPDVIRSPTSPQVGFVHRHTDAADVYFLANTANEPAAIDVTCNVHRQSCQQWDALTGRSISLSADTSGHGGRVQVRLEPYGSTVLVWTDSPAATTQPSTPAASLVEIDLSRDWSVRFGQNAAPTPMPQLADWTASDATRSFSGVTRYTRQINLAAAQREADGAAVLDFGPAAATPAEPDGRPGSPFIAALDPPVRETAVVWINGQRAGAVWCPPYRLEVGRFLKAGDNTIEIDVANTAVNAIAANGFPNYDAAALVARFGKRFDPPKASTFTPQPSGLLGPITLRVERP